MIFFTPELTYFLLKLALILILGLYLIRKKKSADIVDKHELSNAMVSKIQAASCVRHTAKNTTKLVLAEDTILVSENTDCIEIFTETEKEPSTVGAANGLKN